jgi:hypothetical protein
MKPLWIFSIYQLILIKTKLLTILKTKKNVIVNIYFQLYIDFMNIYINFVLS